ncbi:hypothetical protein [Tepidimicrobium xylanilyticum]|uniref:Uncharacterized protein n=1 Tax=Tepidimicrobium xylanilyticum TaxID=1123352 RepID=A0A1H3A9R1_9FIRM|nr:hypothetical protein [Tepidimicrobium xylanilyticum]GMG96293.1 hypothetical protein EN5CB1_11190 [Tepidimicrobium xylanilyticum]SDX25609.1 hypothetical protein SAMN05660923_02008 [Tepidimicrobium xylanilyticum]
MKKDEKIKKALDDLKDFQPTEEQIELIESLANTYANRSEEDIFVEIIRVNEEMEAKMSPEEYEAIFEKLDSIRQLLNEEQLEKLDKILLALKKDHK